MGVENQGERTETDALGEVSVPGDAYWGAATGRAIDNFPVSGIPFDIEFIRAVALIKSCAARVNTKLNLLEKQTADAVRQAAQEIIEGKSADQFPLDIFQTGSGTSTNMNVNEVVASRANEILTGEKGGRSPVHPNDHVNLGQSSNDVIPSALHISACVMIESELLPAVNRLEAALRDKAERFSDVLKIGRTHLQDAIPVFLGREFGSFARQAALGAERIRTACDGLKELALGGTAVGNGANAPKGFAEQVIRLVSDHTGIDFRRAENGFEAQGARDAAVYMSGALKTYAGSLIKIANDIRWLASGPRCGIGEINLPALQPGSSIMPGKINPVIPESVIQAGVQVTGNDTAISVSGQMGVLELNTMIPVMAHNLLQSITLCANSSRILSEKCVEGITANREKCSSGISSSLAMATCLVPKIGYDRASDIAKKAFSRDRTVKEIVLEEAVMGEEDFEQLSREFFGTGPDPGGNKGNEK